MTRKLAICVLAALAVVPAAYASTGPTPGQVHAAVRRAERSKQLWTTINICDIASQPDRVGIRGQMPALGFPAHLSMAIQIEYWDAAAGAFRPVPGGNVQVKLGIVTSGLEQGGHTFQFAPGTGLVTGTITFRWRRAGKLIGRAVKPATAGHRSAANGSPPHYSAASCNIS